MDCQKREKLKRVIPMRFKYARELSELEDCSPTYYESRGFTAYRFVFADISHPNNFLPALKINPRRINSPPFVSDTTRCLGWAMRFRCLIQSRMPVAAIVRSVASIAIFTELSAHTSLALKLNRLMASLLPRMATDISACTKLKIRTWVQSSVLWRRYNVTHSKRFACSQSSYQKRTIDCRSHPF